VELSDEQRTALAGFIRDHAEAREVRILEAALMGGGAIQENWALEVEIEGGPRPGRHALVMRADAPSAVAVSLTRPQEFAILEVMHERGITVPEPWCVADDPALIGRPFYLMQRLPGEAQGHRVVRDPAVRERGEALAFRLGREMARIHEVEPPHPRLAFLPVPEGSPAVARVEEYRRHLDAMGEAQPALEWALRWLELNAPPKGRVCFCHGDFRTGNYLVDEGELQGLLDWEFAAWSDPYEDLGWMFGRFWRFGADEREAGGVGSREAFYRGYEAEAGHPLDRAIVPYWEVMGTVRWAVIALQQARRHFDGGEASLELALTAHVVPRLERDILDLLERIERGEGG